jgi:nitric oxide reductase large subunit
MADQFFLAVAFWHMLGAGLFGFMIKPPIALYYMQDLNATPVHTTLEVANRQIVSGTLKRVTAFQT